MTPPRFVALAYCVPELRARVVPCVFRCGVWAVAKPAVRGTTYQIVHAPSGGMVRSFATKREAVRVCRRLGEACGMWAFDCGFGDAPDLPAKVARLAGARAVERVG